MRDGKGVGKVKDWTGGKRKRGKGRRERKGRRRRRSGFPVSALRSAVSVAKHTTLHHLNVTTRRACRVDSSWSTWLQLLIVMHQ